VFSFPFTVSNGVKQGGVLSPVLFCVYIDSLLHSVAECGVGCFIGRVFVGALVYADDIVLLSHTAATGMRTLLHVCNMFANDFSAVFNAAKSKCLTVYGSKLGASLLYTIRTLLVFLSSGKNAIEFVSSWPHLGHILTTNMNDKTDIEQRKHSLCGQINDVLCYYGKRQSIVKLQLMKIHCTSFYGSVLWDLDHRAINAFCAT